MKTYTVTIQFEVTNSSIAGAAETAESLSHNIPGASVVSVEEKPATP
jgi:hypothetical protein